METYLSSVQHSAATFVCVGVSKGLTAVPSKCSLQMKSEFPLSYFLHLRLLSFLQTQFLPKSLEWHLSPCVDKVSPIISSGLVMWPQDVDPRLCFQCWHTFSLFALGQSVCVCVLKCIKAAVGGSSQHSEGPAHLFFKILERPLTEHQIERTSGPVRWLSL